jgi:predicted Kef-type K+ transport protein
VFFFGLLAHYKGLPPLVGFLVGGFAINFVVTERGIIHEVIQVMADVGVMLLLFTIGLKLKVKSLLKPVIWGTTLIHMIFMVALFSACIFALGFFGLQYFANVDLESALMIGFALSFSSTVYVVKSLENSGEMSSIHGKTAIGILVIQDIIAVVFIAISSGKVPSLWVLILPLWLWVLQKLLSRLLDIVGHGEMIYVFGFFTTFIAGAFSFYLFGLKPDLGALIMGMLLVNHSKVGELYDKIIEYKDFFLIAFFINVGLIGLPTVQTISMAFILLPLVILKGVFFSSLFTWFKLPKRSIYLASLSLSNFSEFGLIVGIVGFNLGLLSADWIVVMALLMSFSFLFASPIQKYSRKILKTMEPFILRTGEFRFIKRDLDAEQVPLKIAEAQFVVVGMGSIGRPVYDQLQQKFPGKVIGFDFDGDKIIELDKLGFRVYGTDITYGEIWKYIEIESIEAIYLTISDFKVNLSVLDPIRSIEKGNFKVYALTQYSDQADSYLKNGVDFVFNYKERLGADFVANTLVFQGEPAETVYLRG